MLTRGSWELFKRNTLFPIQYFTGNGVNKTFDLNRIVSRPEEINVYITGVRQYPDSYTVNSGGLSFDMAPPNTGQKDDIAIEFLGPYMETITDVPNGTITAAKLSDSNDELRDISFKVRIKQNGPPSTGTYFVGEIVWNAAPNTGQYIGWVCTMAGTPGSWKGFGLIA